MGCCRKTLANRSYVCFPEEDFKVTGIGSEGKEAANTKSGWAESRVKLQAFRDEYNELVAELNSDQTPVDDRDDVTISQNMLQLQSWKKTYTKIVSN